MGDSETDGSGDDAVGEKSVETISGSFETPTRLATAAEIPSFEDDLAFQDLGKVVTRQLKRFADVDLTGDIRFGDKVFPLSRIREGLERFRALVSSYEKCMLKSGDRDCLRTVNQDIRRNFDIFIPDLLPSEIDGKDPRPAFFTAYYTPTLDVSSRPTEIYKHAVFGRPTEELSELAEKYTRAEIDFDGRLTGRGLELYWAKDLFELYSVHIEGGARVIVRDQGNRVQYLSFDKTNRKSWRFISKYMMEKGYIKDASFQSQARFLRENPHRQREIYEYCPSYVYFKRTDHEPEGSDHVPLTDNRSIATDRKLYAFKGNLAYIEAERPVEGSGDDGSPIKMRRFSRFVVDQDTGGAIKGKARVDIYFGKGDYAHLAAQNTKSRGRLFFFVLKDSAQKQKSESPE
jgi:membrane-bound lytic murein transglycosylase A